MEAGAQALHVATDGGLTVPVGQSPIAQNVQDVIINNGDLNLAGRDVIIQQHYHNYSKSGMSIVIALRMVRNLRKIHLDILSKATLGTGVWLLKTEEFLIWLDLNGNLRILWGSGIPGAGKSVLASIVINELEARAAAAGGSICVCYVYFRYSDAFGLTVRGILEILVKQTIERHPECMSLAEEAYARHLHEDTQPTESDLLQLLQRFTNEKLTTFYVLEALDEAPDKLQLDLIKKLASLNVRLFITSRPLKGVESRISGVHSFAIIARAEDIELHINKGIQRSPELQNLLEKAGPSLRDEIVTSIKKNCDGMFLHASLQLDALCECSSPREVRLTLEAFPSNIEDVYLHTWDRILQSPRVSLAKSVLTWVLFAARSMKIEELERAVATSPQTHEFEPDRIVPGTTLIAVCRGLVTLEEESGLVRLVHYTAKHTLQGILHDQFPFPHSHLAAVCLTHLAKCNFKNTTIRSEDEFARARRADPLLAYASYAWASHARASLGDEDTKRRTAVFITESRAFPDFISPNQSHMFDILSPLHILALYNLPISLITPDNVGEPGIATKIQQASPLMLASWHGNLSLVQDLLRQPKPVVNFTDKDGWSALMLAAIQGHERTVAVLLAQPDIQINLTDSDGWSAVMKAGRRGYEGTVKLLLARPEIQVNSVNNTGWSVLMKAACNGHESTVKLLLGRPDIQVNLIDNRGWSALMWAALYGHETIVRLLLACSEILVNLVDSDGWSALIKAARFGHKGTVKLLLACPETKVNLANNTGWSALMHGAKYGRKGIVKLLLSRPNIQVNLVNSAGWSALMWAAFYGHEAIVGLLLACLEIQVNLVDNDGWSALMKAARFGHDGTVKLLLTRPEIKVNLANNTGWSALMKAACNGHDAIVSRFLARSDTRVNLVNHEGQSALILAVQGGHETIVHLLLNVPDIKTRVKTTDDGQTPISIALNSGHNGIAQLLEDFDRRKGSGFKELSAVNLEQLSSEDPVDAERQNGSDSEDSNSYQDAEDWLEEGRPRLLPWS